MSEELKYKLYTNGDCIPEQTLFDYIDQRLSPKEQHAVEKHLLDCEMCSEALEGLSILKDRGRIGRINEAVRQKMSDTERKIVFFNYRIAMSVAAGLLLLVGGVFFFNQFTSKEMMSSDMAENKEEAPPPPSDLPLKDQETVNSVTALSQETVMDKEAESLKREKGSGDQLEAPIQNSVAEASGESKVTEAYYSALDDSKTVTDELKAEKKAPAAATPDEENSRLGFLSNTSTAPNTTVVITESTVTHDLDKQLLESPNKGNVAAGAAMERDANESYRKEEQKDAKQSVEKRANKNELISKGKKKEDEKTPTFFNVETANNQAKPAVEKEYKKDNVTTKTGDDREDIGAKIDQTVSEITVSADIAAKDVEEDGYSVVDEMPEYPGGLSELNKYITKDLPSPKESPISSKLYLGLTIDEDGKVSKSEIIKGIDPEFDKEVLRRANAMPKWKPGKLNGKTVKVKMNLPFNIHFK